MSLYDTINFQYGYYFKILIIGDSGVGKTALLQRFSHDYFVANNVPSVGIEIEVREIHIDNKCCKLAVWDAAGQDRFKSLVPSFYRDAHGVIICFDITDIESFRNVEKWLEEMMRFCPENIPVFLVGTKADLKSRRMISREMKAECAENMTLTYIETSSKTGENIEHCFSYFSVKLIEHTERMKLTEKRKLTIDPSIHLQKKAVPDGNRFGSSTCAI